MSTTDGSWAKTGEMTIPEVGGNLGVLQIQRTLCINNYHRISRISCKSQKGIYIYKGIDFVPKVNHDGMKCPPRNGNMSMFFQNSVTSVVIDVF